LEISLIIGFFGKGSDFFRHTCAALLLCAGENPKVVSERLGHARIILIMDAYSHVLPDTNNPSFQEYVDKKWK
jgi:integrase